MVLMPPSEAPHISTTVCLRPGIKLQDEGFQSCQRQVVFLPAPATNDDPGRSYERLGILEGDPFLNLKSFLKTRPEDSTFIQRIEARLEGVDLTRYSAFLRNVARSGALKHTDYAFLFSNCVLMELEHLPGHLAFYAKTCGSSLAIRFNPAYILNTALIAAEGGMFTSCLTNEYRKAAKSIWTYIKQMPLDILLSTAQCRQGSLQWHLSRESERELLAPYKDRPGEVAEFRAIVNRTRATYRYR